MGRTTSQATICDLHWVLGHCECVLHCWALMGLAHASTAARSANLADAHTANCRFLDLDFGIFPARCMHPDQTGMLVGWGSGLNARGARRIAHGGGGGGGGDMGGTRAIDC